LSLTTKLLLFKVNYGREPRMGFEIKKKKGKACKSRRVCKRNEENE